MRMARHQDRETGGSSEVLAARLPWRWCARYLPWGSYSAAEIRMLKCTWHQRVRDVDAG
jgi:hypothetical protein